jgi:hypothetical protein
MRLWSSVSKSLDITIWLKFASLMMNLIESSFQIKKKRRITKAFWLCFGNEITLS